MEGKYRLVICTVSSEEEAKRIGMALVKDKLAACFNIIPGVKSIYTWKGELHEDEELIVFIKTRKDLFEKVKESIKSNHSYECPEIIAIPITDAFKNYLEWIDENTL